jgi:hypothetical protein
MADTAHIDVAIKFQDFPPELQEELRTIEDKRASCGFEFRGRRFFYTEFLNDPDDYDPGYRTSLSLDEPLPEFLEGLPIRCTARFPRITTDIGRMHFYAHGMVRNTASDPLHVDLQAMGDNLARLQHVTKSMLEAIETMPEVESPAATS